MKLFQSTQKYLAHTGLSRGQSVLNTKLLTVFAVYWLTTISTGVFFIYEANTFKEYTYSFLCTSGFVTETIVFMIGVVKMPKFFQLFDTAEMIVECSKSILKAIKK